LVAEHIVDPSLHVSSLLEIEMESHAEIFENVCEFYL